ncbi:hypothetical protein NUW58_g9359 [Xylaria curta]|uniref:Uncharacterized protein n=1 Tax=Xylaria curta TaxID=42375 RepID=A0ACC1MXA2_9PEZI|nr:hypothetical protein NUW58_g9359 [Xylaria curta]
MTPSCEIQHQSSVCTQCVTTWIRSNIESRGTRITCPQCNSELDYFTIKRLTDEDIFQRYETLVVTTLLEQEPDFVWCAHACGSGQTHPAGSDEPIMTCWACSRRTCVVHRLPWHPGITCRQFDEQLVAGGWSQHMAPRDQLLTQQTQAALQRARDDAVSRDIVRGISKACPNCRFDVQKDGGCDMMTFLINSSTLADHPIEQEQIHFGSSIMTNSEKQPERSLGEMFELQELWPNAKKVGEEKAAYDQLMAKKPMPGESSDKWTHQRKKSLVTDPVKPGNVTYGKGSCVDRYSGKQKEPASR